MLNASSCRTFTLPWRALFCSATLFLLVILVFGLDSRAATAEPQADPKLQLLLIQKRDVLDRRYQTIKALNEAANQEYTTEMVFAAEMDKLDVELQLAGSKDAKLRILKLMLANRKSTEAYFRQLYELQSPVPFGVRYFRSTADRIDVEIAIHQLTNQNGSPAQAPERD